MKPTAVSARLMFLVAGVATLLALSASAAGSGWRSGQHPDVASLRSLASAEQLPLPRSSPPPRSTLLWAADLEEGSLADWFFPEQREQGDHGGGVYSSGAANATATTDQSRSGTWSAKLELPTGRGGTRLFRWRELRDHRELVISVWLKLPQAYELTADPAEGAFLNVFQFKSLSVSGDNDSIWYLDLTRSSSRALTVNLVWWHRDLEGPARGQHGFRRFRQQTAEVPVGRWFELKAHIRQSKDFDGLLRVWQDDKLLYDLTGIRTSYANCAYNAWCTSNGWSVNNYSDGLAPAPASIYVDDAQIGVPLAGAATPALPSLR